MRTVRKAIGHFASAVPLLCVPAGAIAQDIGSANSITVNPQLDRTDAAGARNEPEFAPQPILVGPFLIEPRQSIVIGYNSNVRNSANKQGDAVLTLSPRLRLRADTPLHLFQVTATGFIRRFASLKSENSEEYSIRNQSRFDFDEQNALFANAAHSREIEPRSSFTANPAAAEPVSYSITEGEVGANIALGALRISPSVNIGQSDYSALDLAGGGSADQSFRDVRRVGAGLSVGYNFSPLVAVFAAGDFTDQDNRDPTPGFDRSAQDFSVVTGIRGELSPVMSGEVAVGYRKRDYDLALFKDFGGFTYRADLQYFPTELVSLRLQAQQIFRNAGDPQIAGVLSNSLTASAYYDPLRNLRLSAEAGYEVNDFREVDTQAKRPSLRFQGEYRFNRKLSVGAYAGVLRQDVSGTLALQEFTSFNAGFGVTLTP